MLLSSAFVRRLKVATLICGLALFSNAVQAQAPATPTPAVSAARSDQDRPILRRGDNPAPKADEVVSTINVPIQIASTGPEIAPGLALPSTGRIWALDTLEGKPELVHLMYFRTDVDRHAVSNFAKVNLAPFIAKGTARRKISRASASTDSGNLRAMHRNRQRRCGNRPIKG